MAAGRRLLDTLNLNGNQVPATSGGRVLGAHVAYQTGVRNVLAQDRIAKATVVCERIRWAPLPMHVRANLHARVRVCAPACTRACACMHARYLRRQW